MSSSRSPDENLDSHLLDLVPRPESPPCELAAYDWTESIAEGDRFSSTTTPDGSSCKSLFRPLADLLTRGDKCCMQDIVGIKRAGRVSATLTRMSAVLPRDIAVSGRDLTVDLLGLDLEPYAFLLPSDAHFLGLDIAEPYTPVDFPNGTGSSSVGDPAGAPWSHWYHAASSRDDHLDGSSDFSATLDTVAVLLLHSEDSQHPEQSMPACALHPGPAFTDPAAPSARSQSQAAADHRLRRLAPRPDPGTTLQTDGPCPPASDGGANAALPAAAAPSPRVHRCDLPGCGGRAFFDFRSLARHKEFVHDSPAEMPCGAVLNRRPDNRLRHARRCSVCAEAVERAVAADRAMPER